MNESDGVGGTLATEYRASRRQTTLDRLVDPSLDPLFWRAQRVGVSSSWWVHVPFAHWIVSGARPSLLVELGTGDGVAYSAFCQAVRLSGLATRCHAVATWPNDEAYDELVAFNEAHFSAFSTLIRSHINA